ncbi:MAG TPA: thymidine phosphorylase [Candidatus Didemnitutus sp.]|nr:thymidine phosphorylase [Candidatus Didemnitutus sp.]
MPETTPPTPAEVTLKRVQRLAALDAWGYVIIAGICALATLGFGDLLGAIVGLLIVVGGVIELRGLGRLKRRDASGMKLLVRAEFWVLAVITVYCARCLGSFDAGYLRDDVIPHMRETASAFGANFDDLIRDGLHLSPDQLVPFIRKVFFLFYGTVLAVTFLYQGGMALYFRRRVAVVTEALSPPNQQRWEKPPPAPPPGGQVYTLKRPAANGPFFPQDIIGRKRDGAELTREEIEFFVRGTVDGKFADYQASALLMAIFWRGLTAQETAWLTEAMTRSGETIDLSDLSGAKVDKHSTGGVGDKVSLILAPLVAACGVKVPMMSGRGLGHTGGTLDKLEAIPGFRVNLGVPEFRLTLERVGCAMIGQTAQFVPADRKLYALRDVTATVECIPLICASIMSKKLAEGIDSLVLDVKFGRGAFIKPKERALELAQALVAIGRAAGKPVRAVLTAMEQPLGRCVGHTTEVFEAIECLKGRGPADLMEVTYALCGHMLVLGGAAPDLAEAKRKLTAAISSGAALRKFQELCVAQGGDPRVIDDPRLMPTASIITELRAPAGTGGFVGGVDALKVAQAVMILGGGRATVADAVDHAVGISDLVKAGEPVAASSRLCTLHANDATKAARAEALLREAITFSPGFPRLEPLVQDVIE